MTRDPDWNLLARYFSGRASAADTAWLEVWLAEDPSHATLLAQMEAAWDAAGRQIPGRGSAGFDLEAGWASVARRIEGSLPQSAAPEPAARRHDRPASRRTTPRSSAYRSWRQGAGLVAIVAITALTVIVGQKLLGPFAPAVTESSVPLRTVTTEPGQRASTRLEDGTMVKLNVDSELRITSDFNREQRVVHLEGEAFFEVMPDPGRPFVIHVGDAVVEVVGTAFNARAYPDENRAEVAVTEGRVALRSGYAATRDTVLLRPNDVGVVSGGALSARRQVDLTRYVAWRDGRLIFEAAPFEEVAAQLERWYDLDIELKVPPSHIRALNATFTDESLSEILNAIAAALDLEFEWHRRQIVFYPADHDLR